LSNPARICAFDERFSKLFDKYPNQIRPLGLRVKTDLTAIGFKQKDIFTSSISAVPPWLLNRPFVDLSLNNFAKSETNAVVLKANFWKSVIAYKVFVRFTQMDQKLTTAQQQQP